MSLKWLMTCCLFWGTMTAVCADDALFYQQVPLPDSISWVVYKGEAYQQFLVRETDPPQPQWGDGANNQLRKRAQIVPTYRTPLGNIKTLSFHFLIPEEWQLSEQPIWMVGGHTNNVPNGPWGLYINRNKLQFEIQIDNPNGNPPDPKDTIHTVISEKIPFEIDRLHEFKLEMRVAKDMSGYAKAYLDGQQFVDYKGPTVSANEIGLPYDKIGPYVFSKNDKWPFPHEGHKRILMRIP